MLELKFNETHFNYKRLICLSVIALLLIISFLSIASFKRYSEPTLIGKWQSLETRQEVIFTEGGVVTLVNSSQTGTYVLLSASEMAYTIDNKTFVMYYHLDGRTLSWGTNKETPELFTKKSYF